MDSPHGPFGIAAHGLRRRHQRQRICHNHQRAGVSRYRQCHRGPAAGTHVACPVNGARKPQGPPFRVD